MKLLNRKRAPIARTVNENPSSFCFKAPFHLPGLKENWAEKTGRRSVIFYTRVIWEP